MQKVGEKKNTEENPTQLAFFFFFFGLPWSVVGHPNSFVFQINVLAICSNQIIQPPQPPSKKNLESKKWTRFQLLKSSHLFNEPKFS